MASEYSKNIKFVQMVEKYPCLYDYRLPEYMRKDETEKAWDEIGQHFQLTGSESKERWKNLRSVFVRHLRPAKTGSSKGHKKPYYLSEFMQFAIPFIKTPNNESNEVVKQTQRNSELDEVLVNEDVPSTSYSNKESMTSRTLPPKKKTPIVRKKFLSTTKEMAALKFKRANMIEDRNAEICSKSNKNFLLSLLSDMNQMNDKQRRVFKRKVLGLVEEILDDDSEEFDGVCNIVASPVHGFEASAVKVEDGLDETLYAQQWSEGDDQ